MRQLQVAVAAIAVFTIGYLVHAQQNGQTASAPIPAGLPEWAYAPPPPPAPGAQPARPPQRPPDDGTLRRVPGSNVALTMTQIRGIPEIPDWHPEDHGPMPDIVKVGKQGGFACGFCHLANGRGRPENAGPAGLPVAYFMQQMEDFKNGSRKSSDPRKGNTNLMIGYAKAITDAELKASAEYFAANSFPQWIKVKETKTVPKTRLAGGMYLPLEGSEAGEEPIGNRIIEVPEYPDRTEVRDSHAGFIAYVPVGSIKKGEAIAGKGQCTVCHGPSLGGVGPVPPIAGRSPSYVARQLFDMQTGARHGLWADLMKQAVATLTAHDLVNISAYVASRAPGSAGTRQTGSR
jgi:cytochrome c553